MGDVMSFKDSGGVVHRFRIPNVVGVVDGPLSMGRRVFIEPVAYRPPVRGEYYVSGAIPELYRAKRDLPMDHCVVRPTHRATRATVEVKGEPL